MRYMFVLTGVFNQPTRWMGYVKLDKYGADVSICRMPLISRIGDWDTSNVTDMSYMFYAADAFNQPHR